MWQWSQSHPHRSGRQRARERIWGERVGPGRGQRLSQSCRATWPDSRDCLWPALVCLGLGVLDGGVAGLLGPVDGAAAVDRHSSSELSGNPGAGQGDLPRLWRVPPGPLSLRQPKFSSVMALQRTVPHPGARRQRGPVPPPVHPHCCAARSCLASIPPRSFTPSHRSSPRRTGSGPRRLPAHRSAD